MGTPEEILADRIWWTRKARIQAEIRILFYARHAQLLVLWYSFVAVVVSIFYSIGSDDSESLAIASISFSILVLVASAFLNGLSHKERASLIKECYEKLQDLYSKAKAGVGVSQELSEEYESVLALCENHTSTDYYTAVCESYLTATDKQAVDRHPTRFIWLVVILAHGTRRLTLGALYLFPLVLFSVFEAYPIRA